MPEVLPRSVATAESVTNGADHCTVTALEIPADRVTVKTALLPSDTLDAGPAMLSSACSGLMLFSASVRVIVASLTSKPAVVVPDSTIVSSPSSTWSAVGSILSVPVPVLELDGMVTLAKADVTE